MSSSGAWRAYFWSYVSQSLWARGPRRFWAGMKMEDEDKAWLYAMAPALLIKPISDGCNLRCEYCFYRGTPPYEVSTSDPSLSSRRMSLEVLEKLTEAYLGLSPEVATFVWQGGEPLLMGIDFFRKALEFQEKYRLPGQKVSNSVQTNGLLLTEEWASFLKDNNFLVGISLDGPRKYHDKYRHDARHRGSFDGVVEAIKLLEDHGVEFNVLCVVNSYNVKEPWQIYSYFRKHGFRFLQFIPCAERDEIRGEQGGVASFSADPMEYGKFLYVTFEQWAKDLFTSRPMSIRYFDNLVDLLAGYGSELCMLQEACPIQIVVEHNGDAYPCDYFVSEDWRLGNMMNTPLQELLDGQRAKAFRERSILRNPDCLACRWRELCQGGCPKYRALTTGDPLAKDYFCESFRYFFEHAFDKLVAITNRLVSDIVKADRLRAI